MDTDAAKLRRQALLAPPRTLDVRKYAECRAAEIESLHTIVSNRLGNDFRSRRSKRRRTTGFESKNRRFWKHSTSKDKEESKNQNDNEQKKLPRRVRRKIELTKKNPEFGFSVSGDGTKRLRTHVWHAKRFTMEKLWGFYLPSGLHGRGKGSRALLKWHRQGAVVHDASYYSAVQLDGPEDTLSSILSMLLRPSPTDRCEDNCTRLLSGEIYGRAMLHHAKQDSYKAICPVTFMWRPLQQQSIVGTNDRVTEDSIEIKSSSCLRQLWIWMHPSAFDEGLDCLKLACQKMMNDTGVVIGCVSLDGKFATLEVMGLKSFQLLQKLLRPITFSVETGSTTEYTDGDLGKEESFSPGTAVLLTVVDPRFSCHKKAEVLPVAHLSKDPKESMQDKCEQNSTGNLIMKEGVLSTSLSKDESTSSLFMCKDLWDASNGVNPPMEEHILCSKRHQKSLDFFCSKSTASTIFETTEGSYSNLCPIMLLKNADEASLHIGWTIILPICWVKALWIPLISGGAHAIGLREKHWIACDVGLPCFPQDFPDCNANYYMMEKAAAAFDKTMENQSFATRPLRIPIQLPWNSKWFLSNLEGNGDYSGNLDGKLNDVPLSNNCGFSEVSVARTSRMLNSFLKEVSGENLLIYPKGIDRPRFSHVMMNEAKISQGSNLTSLTTDRRLCYLRVVLHAFKEGVFDERAVVCAPRFSDITSLTSRLVNDEGIQVPHAHFGSYFKELPSGKWDFQLPEDPAAREAYRAPIGFVTTGFVRGSKRPAAVAFCEAVLLARFRHEQWSRFPAKKRRKEIFVLVRNLSSTAYRLALATIVLERQEEDVESL
ncbi:ribonucleases P/MRP protein subunit POP1 isoform X1 [Amaranthus tricolor]|uniref:ribonucleases P/MRP protein subunit POP1 isoform X1 n=1 Tax=Amaranthus tricolor TaxID=29722 RepID=UPI00258E8BF3|nr:ribonucleases P/MRP protein subunit POP1 isoform X1 [Amaranthus tricolor]XP_057519157.1 ribonucleases P/MRP protein subunit POP1 isoform X1 [Amaranthus tricolor]